MAIGQGKAITVDDLLVLNQEIAALVRAGTPLERGLASAGRDVRGRLGRIARLLGERMSRGESLVDALEHERDSIPPLYRAVVEAGVRSGRLPTALEGMSRYVRGYSEAREAVGLALWYPLLIVAIAYGLFIMLTVVVAPRFAGAFPGLEIEPPKALALLTWLGENAHLWWPIGPALFFLLGMTWVATGRAARFGSWGWGLPRLVPGMSRFMADYETANFAELLALLLEHQVGYATAVVLAGESTGNPRITQATRDLAAELNRGHDAAAATEAIDASPFQPMIRWALSTADGPGSLAERLRGLADHYRNRARFRAESMKIWLPSLLLVVLGGSAALIYGLSLFIPLINLLSKLSLG